MSQQLRHRAGSAALIIGFFLLWELFCWGGGISDVVLPRPSKVFVTLFLRFPAIWPHASVRQAGTPLSEYRQWR